MSDESVRRRVTNFFDYSDRVIAEQCAGIEDKKEASKKAIKLQRDMLVELFAEEMNECKAGAIIESDDPDLQPMMASSYAPIFQLFMGLRSLASDRKLKQSKNKKIDRKYRNQWYSHRLGGWVYLFEENGKIGWVVDKKEHLKIDLIRGTYKASGLMTARAEFKALKKLKTVVSKDQYDGYILSNSIIEQSPKSKLWYVFRKCRPTLVFSQSPQRTSTFLAALCCHPIGYYGISWMGAMVPTDDVVAHILLMRGDEHRFWKKSTQHQQYNAQADF